MGAWGPGIYQDDVAQDVRDDYIELLKKEVPKEQAVELIKESYMEEIEDEDDQSVFWIALADTMWKVGRLTEEVKQKALEIIENKQDLEKWKESQKEYEKRARTRKEKA